MINEYNKICADCIWFKELFNSNDFYEKQIKLAARLVLNNIEEINWRAYLIHSHKKRSDIKTGLIDINKLFKIDIIKIIKNSYECHSILYNLLYKEEKIESYHSFIYILLSEYLNFFISDVTNSKTHYHCQLSLDIKWREHYFNEKLRNNDRTAQSVCLNKNRKYLVKKLQILSLYSY